MKKTKIVLFTLLLSIIGVVGSTNAASVNSSSRNADLMPSTASQLIQNSSLNEANIENSESGKCILWSPRIRNFKKGDQVKILLPNGKYTGKTLTIKIVDHGEEIATLTVECGCDYGIITFMADANSSQIAQIIAGFGSMDFGAVSAGDVIDIGGGMTGGCIGNTASKAPVAPGISFSSSLSNRNDDNLGSLSIDTHSSSIKATSSLNLRSSSSSLSDEEDGKVVTRSFSSLSSTASRSSRSSSSSSHGKEIIIDYGPGQMSSSSVNLKSSLSSSLISASSTDKDSHRHSGWRSEKSTSRSNCSSSVKGNGHHSRRSIIIVVPVPEPGPVKENSLSINLNHSSSMLKVPAKIDHSSKKLPNVSKKVKPAHKNTKTKDEPAKARTVKAVKTNVKDESHLAWKESVAGLPKKQATKSDVGQASQQNGSLHLNPQQVRVLNHEVHFSNSKAAEAVKKLDTSALHGTIYGSAATPNNSKQGLTLKHWNAAHPGSKVRRITLPIQGILPATRMDSYTWVYSLVGLAIMIISGRAFFSKKRK